MAESDKNSDAAPTGSLGLKAFNQTGRDDATSKIIRPKVDPKVRTRNMILGAFVVVGMCIVFYIAFMRSGISIDEITREDNTSFGTAKDKMRQDFDSVNKDK